MLSAKYRPFCAGLNVLWQILLYLPEVVEVDVLVVLSVVVLAVVVLAVVVPVVVPVAVVVELGPASMNKYRMAERLSTTLKWKLNRLSFLLNLSSQEFLVQLHQMTSNLFQCGDHDRPVYIVYIKRSIDEYTYRVTGRQADRPADRQKEPNRDKNPYYVCLHYYTGIITSETEMQCLVLWRIWLFLNS